MRIPDQKRNKKLLELRAKGLSYRELARVFEIDVHAAFEVVRKYGKKKRG